MRLEKIEVRNFVEFPGDAFDFEELRDRVMSGQFPDFSEHGIFNLVRPMLEQREEPYFAQEQQVFRIVIL